ncbi:MAG: Uma2 family endonuclease [Isosphaerales bacterium]
MSTAERVKLKTLPPLEAGQHLEQPTFHDRYEAMPPDTRAELVGGVVYMPSPLSGDHGEEHSNVSGWLFHYRRFTPGVRSPNDTTVKLDPQGEPQPDCQLRIPAELGGQTYVDDEGYIAGAPELVVEVARSSRYYDLKQKKADYERAGVREYVVVELDPNRIHWFIRRGTRFAVLRPGPDGIYRSRVFPGLWLDPKALYAEDLDRLIQVLEQGLATREHAAFVARLAAAWAGRKPR